MSDEQKRAHWRFDAARLRDDVSHLVWLRKTHRRLQMIISQNSRLNVASPFHDFVVEGYVAAASVGVRRLSYTSGSAISFSRLLTDVKKHLPLLTRDALCALYGDRFRFSFDQLVGHDRGTLSDAEIDEDLNALRTDAERVKQYVDQRVAHISRKPSGEVPRFEDLHRAIDNLERIALKYGALLTGDVFFDLDKLETPDMTDVLTFAWIEEPDV